MNKGTHFSGQPMYGQLINLLSKDEILKFSHNRNGERYVKHFDAYQHLAVMLYAVIKRFDSLREITDSMFPEARKLAHLGIGMMPRRSTLSDATPADLRQCLRTRTAVCMPDIKMNFPRTAESGKCFMASSSANHRFHYNIAVLQPHIQRRWPASQNRKEERRHKSAHQHPCK